MAMFFTFRDVFDFHFEAMDDTCQHINQTHGIRSNTHAARIVMQRNGIVSFSDRLVEDDRADEMTKGLFATASLTVKAGP